MIARIILALATVAPATLAFAAEAPFSEAEKNFRAALELVAAKHRDEGLTKDKLYELATAGMLEKLGNPEWSRLMTPAEYKGLMSDVKGSVTGIGIELDLDAGAGLANVRAVIPGAAAAAAGVRAGDRILKVDGKTLRGLELPAVVDLIRGPEGAPVTLRVLRDDEVREVKVVRKAMTWNPVETTPLADGTWLLSVRAFNDNTPKALDDAAKTLASGGAKAVVLDLRGNSGGAVTPAMDSASRLLPKGARIATATERGGREQPYASADGGSLGKLPLVAVLVNEHTSSSAEIIAEALRQQRKAPLVGRTTHGKWNGQRVEELPNGYAIRFTTMRFAAPDGRSFDGKGVTPDLEVAMEPEVAEKARFAKDAADRLAQDAQLRAALALAAR